MPALEAASLHRWAMRCAADAESLGTSNNERARLLTMYEALLVLADSPNWFCEIAVRKPLQNATAIRSLGS